MLQCPCPILFLMVPGLFVLVGAAMIALEHRDRKVSHTRRKEDRQCS